MKQVLMKLHNFNWQIGGVQTLREILRATNPSALSSQSRPPNIGNLSLGRSSIKGKEKVTSLLPLPETLSIGPKQPIATGLAMRRSNLHSGVARDREDFRHDHHSTIRRRLDLASDGRDYTIESSALSEFLDALKECSPPGAEIPDPYA